MMLQQKLRVFNYFSEFIFCSSLKNKKKTKKETIISSVNTLGRILRYVNFFDASTDLLLFIMKFSKKNFLY